MSYIFNNQIRYADTPNLDGFGRLRTSNITSLLEYKHTYDKLPLVVSEYTAGTSTSVFDSVNSQVVMTTANSGDTVIRMGKSYGIYQPGKSQLIEASFSNFQKEVNVIKRVGYFKSNTIAPYDSIIDGLLLESNGVTDKISFQIWQSGTCISSADTTTWSSTDYDVNNIDWSKSQLLFVDFQWLGVGRVRFNLVIDGLIKTFYTYTAANNINHVYMKAPNQPIRYEIRQVGSGTGGTFNMICSQVSIEGSINALQRSLGLSQFNTINCATSGTKYPLIGYRINTGYEGVNILLSDIQSINATNSGKADYYITVEFNPVLSVTPTFTGVTDSGVAYSIATGQSISTSGYILSGFLGSGSGTQVDSFQFQDNMIRPGINVDGTYDEIWICIVTNGNNQVIRSSINLSYFV